MATPGPKRFELAVQPMVLDRYVLALDEASLVETLTEGIGTGPLVRPTVDDSHCRQCRLLRARREPVPQPGSTMALV